MSNYIIFLIGVLLMDEMKLDESVSFDRQTMRFSGFVDRQLYSRKSKNSSWRSRPCFYVCTILWALDTIVGMLH